ncbi:MAG: hypothetical protein ACJA2X_000039 [Halocynthiibacter sp.]|jgi:hypothetical protein
MSDAMTNPEIEDVVSSIRRLVSEDVRPVARNENAVQEADKFVLTPALRVAEPAPEQQAPKEDAPQMHENEEQSHGDAPAHEEPHVEDGPQAEFGADQPAQPLSDESDEDTWAAPQEEHAQTESAPSNNDTLVLDGSERIEDADQSETEAQHEAHAQAVAPVAEATSPDQHADHTPHHDDIRDEEQSVEFSADPDAEQAQDWQDEAPSTQSLEERIAELEAAVGAQTDEWEPDGSEVETSTAPSATILQYSQSGFGAGAAGLSAAFDDPNADPEPIEGESFAANEFSDDEDDLDGFIAGATAAASEDAILDEAALRELVGVIVREELQGALGERITRNVRRLVRREVQRALSLREFD